MRKPPGRLLELARKTASAHGLDPALVASVVTQESGWNPWAIRYEPAFRWLYPDPTNIYRPKGATLATERTQQRTSWGLMQVMGAVARELGCDFPFLSGLCLPEIGLEYGCRFLAKQAARYDGDTRKALSAYNAGHFTPGNQEDYVDPIMERIEQLRPWVSAAPEKEQSNA